MMEGIWISVHMVFVYFKEITYTLDIILFIYSNLDKNVYANVETKCSTQTNLIYKMHDKCCLLFAFSSDNLSSPHLLVAPSKIDKLYSEYANG